MTSFDAMKFRKGPMKPGEFLSPNESLVSDNGVFELRYQKDGNLVLYAWSSSGKSFLWASDTNGKPLGKVEFTDNGELAVVGPNGEKHYLSEGWRAPVGTNLSLHIQPDGNLVAYDGGPSPAYAYWATDTWKSFNTYALLIGVEDYSTYDGTGNKNLLAGRNDVLAVWKVCRRMGYKPENIRVCTSPALTPADITEAEVDLELSKESNTGKLRDAVKTTQGMDDLRTEARKSVQHALEEVPWSEVLGTADSGHIETQVGWLAERLGKPFREKKGYLVPGILYYSGHGARVNGELALCPSDVKQVENGSLENVLKFSSIEAALSKDNDSNGDGTSPLEYLTVLLDCCTAGAADASPVGQRVSSLIVDTSTTSMDEVNAALKRARESKLGRRTFCGSRADEQGQQALLDGRWRGAFTWAFCRAVEQWKVGSGQGLFAYSNVSHMELLFRTRMQLEALGFAQHPALLDSIGNTPVFWSGVDRVDKGQQLFADDPWILNFLGKPVTVVNPDAPRDGIQLDPSQRSAVYKVEIFSDVAATQLLATACVLAVTANKTVTAFKVTYAARENGCEWWWIPKTFVDALAKAQSLKFTPTKGSQDSEVEAALTQAGVTAQDPIAATAFTTPTWSAARSMPSELFINSSKKAGIVLGSDRVTWYRNDSLTGFLVATETPTTFTLQSPSSSATWTSTTTG